MHEELQIIYKLDGRPDGIRDKSGFLLFFSPLFRWPDQDERYQNEVKKQHDLAEKLFKMLAQNEKLD